MKVEIEYIPKDSDLRIVVSHESIAGETETETVGQMVLMVNIMTKASHELALQKFFDELEGAKIPPGAKVKKHTKPKGSTKPRRPTK